MLVKNEFPVFISSACTVNTGKLISNINSRVFTGVTLSNQNLFNFDTLFGRCSNCNSRSAGIQCQIEM